jgi:hypothetical protein
LFIVIAIAIVVKLWLISEIRTAAWFAPHDAGNFLEHARSLAVGHWFGGYNNLTLIKQPFFPIYLALIEQFGLPLTVANLLFDAFVASVVCIAVSPLFRRPPALELLFLVLFFNPLSYEVWAWTSDRTTLNPSLGLLTVACAIALYLRRRYPIATSLRWMVALGMSFTAFWLCREDAVWIVPSLLVILGAYALWAFRRRRAEFAPRLASIAIPFVMCAIAVFAVMFINGRVYGWKIVNEQQAPEFISAYNSFVRIDVPKTRYYPVPNAALKIAYDASPAARELEPALDGNIGQNWQKNSCAAMTALCGQPGINAGGMEWAIRDATAAAGHYDSAADARAFYLRIAQELDAACDAHRIKCIPKAHNVFPPPITPDAVPAIVASLVHGTGTLLTISFLQFGAPDAPPISEAERLDYDFIARNVYDPDSRQRFRGWVIFDRSRPATITGPGGSNSRIVFSPSPDVANVFAKTPGFTADAKANARFEMLTACNDDCSLVVGGANGSTVSIPLRENVSWYTAPGVAFHIDESHKVAVFDEGLKTNIMVELGRTYQNYLRPMVIIALLLIAWRIVRAALRRRTVLAPQTIAAFGCALGAAAYTILLAIMDALAFNTFIMNYLDAIVAQILFASAFTIACEWQVAYRFLRRRLPAPKRALQPA